MVYRGKPSLGCELCRRRKIRCDQTRPACGQCIKHGVDCPGYRDLGTSNFLDESQAVIRRAQSKRDNSTSSSSSSRRRQSRTDSDPSPDAVANAVARVAIFASSPPAVAFEDRALDYFYNAFVPPGYILFLPDKDGLAGVDAILRNAVLCTACSAYANTFGTRVDLVQARRRYARALSLTNDALRDVESARKDQTLVAVLLLNLFENLDCDNPTRVSSWQNHVRGCSALLRLRDPSKLLTPAGFEIFAQLRPLVLVNCMWDNTTVPPHWSDYLRFSDKYHSPRQRVVNGLIWIGVDIATMRSSIHNGTLSDPMDIYSQVRKLDDRLDAWEQTALANPQWCCEELLDPDADPDVVWRGTGTSSSTSLGTIDPRSLSESAHKYTDFGVSGNWGLYRCIRILMLSMMSFQLLRADQDPNLEEQLRLARLRSRLINESLASSSYMLTAYLRQPGPGEGTTWSARRGSANESHASMPKISAYFEQLVLFWVGTVLITISEESRDECDFERWSEPDRFSPEPLDPVIRAGRQLRIDQLNWVIGRLEFIARSGIRQGAVYASMLRRNWTPGAPFGDPTSAAMPWRLCATVEQRFAALRLTSPPPMAVQPLPIATMP